MPTTASHRLTQLLVAWSEGQREALDELLPLVYDELRRIAHRYMRGERAGHDLQTTALVNEAYLRLVDQRQVRWQNRAHFFAICAQLMRRIIVDRARAQHYQKRGGHARKVALDEATLAVAEERAADLLALDEALRRLAEIDPRKGRIVELRYFGGLSVEETAEVLQVSAVTVMRDWNTAKAWLYSQMTKQ
jgi:RNA polymerase sigma factor (TIGR02999 family)